MLEQLEAALKSTGLPVAHFGWSKAPEGDYIVYAEDGANDLLAGNHHAERAIEGTVDLFTRDDSGASQKAVEVALESLWSLAWSLNSAQLEDDTGYIHVEWVFEAV